MDELLVEFLTESREGLDKLDTDFIVLERSPADADTIASVFRTIHTIKGTCGFLGFANLERLTHAGEHLLANLRDAHFSLDEELTSALLSMVDAVRHTLDHIETYGNDDENSYALLYSQLNDLNTTRLEGGCVPVANPGAQLKASHVDAPERAAAPVDDELAEVIHEFVSESADALECMSGEIVSLEDNPDDKGIIVSLFRTVHTIKATCSFLGFDKLERVTHAAESLLVSMRDSGLKTSPAICNMLVETVKACDAMLCCIGATGHDGKDTYDSLLASLDQLRRRTHGTTGNASGIPTQTGRENGPDLTIDQATSAAGNTASPATPPGEHAGQVAGERAESSIRVDVPRLDSLMNLVGELVLARNQILEHTARLDDPMLNAASSRLNAITGELQDGVMHTRMQPIQSVWAKLPRLARDIARSCGKQVRVEMQGKETELDKSLIEAMKDPMTHLIRNCVDHGIEPPDERLAAGKSAEGVLRLKAFHESGQVHIEVSDDGRGLNAGKIRQRVLDKGLMTPAQVASLSDTESARLIFLPGLSTADTVTNISGRGVGMDVVKSNIDDISGTIDVESTPDAGTMFRICIPLTLAIVPALIVEAGGEQFAIPQVNLLELIRVAPERSEDPFEYIQGHAVYRLRGKLLPIVYLHEQLELDSTAGQDVNIVVLKAHDTCFGLVVDEIHETQEIVVKPLADVLQSAATFAGATIMGDGRVALILDVLGLAARARVISKRRQQADDVLAAEGETSGEDANPLLLVRSRTGARVAIPLHTVSRLEQFNEDTLERSGPQTVVQYRGQILPLVDVSTVLAEDTADLPASRDSVQRVVVFGAHSAHVGLAVDDIVDVVQEPVALTSSQARPGLLGSTVIHEKVTEVFDVKAFLARRPAAVVCAET